MMLNIRLATMEDLEQVTAVEAACFPPAEAAPKSEFENRLKVYPNHFFPHFSVLCKTLSLTLSF